MSLPIIAGQLRCIRRLMVTQRLSMGRGYVTKGPIKSYSAGENDNGEPLPYSAVPCIKDLPVLGTFRLGNRKYYGKIQAMIQDRFDEFGPIFKEKVFGQGFLFTCDANAIEDLIRTSDKSFPARLELVPWTAWRKENDEELGLFTENHDGEKWRRMRSAVDKPLMRPLNVGGYTPVFSEVATDFVKRIRAIRSSGNNVNRLDMELFNWSLEAIGTVLYDIRLGGLSEERDPEMENFIAALQKMFSSTEYLMNLPQFLAKTIMRKWHNIHSESWKVGFQTTRRLIDEKRERISRLTELGEEATGFLAGVISQERLSDKELYANVMELFGAAVDTTSNSMQFALHLLARNPEIQRQLHDEVSSEVPSEDILPSHLHHLPYLKGFVKEVLRLYPPAMLNRFIKEDITLCGYRIPAGTSVIGVSLASGRDPRYFSEPDQVRPERWFRENKAKENINPFSSLPFGYGQRSCIGRRLAELEIYTLLIKISQNFVLQPANEEELSLATRLLLVPEKPVQVLFLDRAR